MLKIECFAAPLAIKTPATLLLYIYLLYFSLPPLPVIPCLFFLLYYISFLLSHFLSPLLTHDHFSSHLSFSPRSSYRTDVVFPLLNFPSVIFLVLFSSIYNGNRHYSTLSRNISHTLPIAIHLMALNVCLYLQITLFIQGPKPQQSL